MSNECEERKEAETLTEAVTAAEEPAAEAAVLPKKKKSKKKWIVIAVIVAAIAVTLLRLLGGGGSAQMPGLGTDIVEAAELRDMTVSVSGTGTIQPIHSGTIVGMVTGDILSDSFEIGDAVEKDQVLYCIDADKAATGVEQAQLAVQQAQLAYDQAKRMAGDLTVTSTVSGQVSDIAVKKGDSVGAGMAVVTVTDNRNMTLKCDFNAADAKNIAPGQSAAVTITATGETVAATVKNVSGFTAVGAGGTLVQSVELTVKNPGGITGGMAATAKVGTYACQSGGNFEYATATQVLSKAGGTVEEILVSEGDAVTPGTQLVRLDGENLQDQVKSAELSLRNAELGLRNAQDMLDEYNIKAPISGTVTQKDLNAGDNIGQVGTTVMAVISDLSALTFDMKIDEVDIPKVKLGQKVEITVDALPGRTFEGVVDKININGVTMNGVTNYPVTVLVENPDPELLPGMNVSAEIIVERAEQVLTIPLAAVQRGDVVRVLPAEAVSEKDGSYDMTQAKEVTVSLGANNEDYVIVESGLSEGDLVVIPSRYIKNPTGWETRNEILEEAGISG